MTNTLKTRQAASGTTIAGPSRLDRDTTAMMRDMATVLLLTRRVAHEIYADVPARNVRAVLEPVTLG